MCHRPLPPLHRYLARLMAAMGCGCHATITCWLAWVSPHEIPPLHHHLLTFKYTIAVPRPLSIRRRRLLFSHWPLPIVINGVRRSLPACPQHLLFLHWACSSRCRRLCRSLFATLPRRWASLPEVQLWDFSGAAPTAGGSEAAWRCEHNYMSFSVGLA